MKLKLAFVNTGPQRGEIRALIPGSKPVTVGDYCKGPNGEWTASLYAHAGKPLPVGGLVIRSTLFTLRRAVGKQGRWWT